MAVVSSETIYLDEERTLKFVKKVKCDKHGQFTCETPQQVGDATGIMIVKSESLEGCQKAFREAFDAWKSVKVETRKVILYELELGDRWQSYSGKIQVAFSAKAYVEKETTSVTGTRFRYDNFDIDDCIWKNHFDAPAGIDAQTGLPFRLGIGIDPRNYKGERYENQVPYNPESVAFFCEIEMAFSRLENMLQAITSDPDQLQKAISRGLKLMSPNQEVNKL